MDAHDLVLQQPAGDENGIPHFKKAQYGKFFTWYKTRSVFDRTYLGDVYETSCGL
jgi:hypothetical protein